MFGEEIPKLKVPLTDKAPSQIPSNLAYLFIEERSPLSFFPVPNLLLSNALGWPLVLVFWEK